MTKAPMLKAIKMDKKIPVITSVALAVLIYCHTVATDSPFAAILIKDIITAAPKSSNTIDTVVEVGRPSVLKKSRSSTSAIITAIKIIITSLKKNFSGTKIPDRAISIIPLEVTAPKNTPKLAMVRMVLNDKDLDPKAEFKKFTASLLTPTIKSTIARIDNAASINK